MGVLFVRIFLLFMVCSPLWAQISMAEYSDPTTRVNVNKQTDLFEQSMDDWSGFQDQIKSQKASALEGVRNKKGLDSITAKSESEIRGSASSLSSIKAIDLKSNGAKAMAKENIMNDIYVDFSRPLNKQHMVDAKNMANAQEKLMGNLLGALKDIGIDCKTVKGAVEKEPAYYLQIEKTQHKDTVYNKTICEELRNQYRCTDSVSLTCKKKGKKYGKWQTKKIKFSGATLHDQKMNWGYASKQHRKYWHWYITPHHPQNSGISQVDSCWSNNPAAIIADARAYIASSLKVDIEQIGRNITFPHAGRGIGYSLFQTVRWRQVWNEYEFGYQYRDASDICAEWEEEWTERCDLNLLTRPTSNRSGERY